MKHTSAGSALFIILIITASLLLYLSSAYRTTLLYTDVVMQKRQHEQQKWYAHGIINWGLALAKVNFDDLLKQLATSGTVIIGLKLSKKVPEGQSGALIFSDGTETSVALKALAKNVESSCTIACRLERRILNTQKHEFSVRNWVFSGE